MKKFLIILSIIAVSLMILSAVLPIYIYAKAEQDTKLKSDVIVVLGEVAITGDSCFGPICQKIHFVPHPKDNPCLVARVDHAVSLYKEGYAPKILMSGGTDADGVNEAETMKNIAVAAGVPATDILTETKSTTTYENLQFSQTIMNDDGLHSAIIVTEPYHNARAGLVAAKLHYDYTLSPAVDSPCWVQNNFFANWNSIKRESLALIGYKLEGKI